ICSSAPAATSACRTSCSGTSRTQSFISPRRCGPISAPTIFPQRSRTTRRESAALVGSTMLKDRILTALVVAPPVLAIMFFARAIVFECLVAAAIVCGAWEWSGLMDCATRRGRIIFTVLVAVLVTATGIWMAVDSQAFRYMIVLALIWWLVVFAW